MKSVRRVLPSQKVNMGGIILDQPLPQKGIDQIDPFLLVHHWHQKYNGGEQQQNVGVGPHPHRGFSPVTFIFKGGVHHRDSTGTSGVINEGGTQWMNSGNGIVHSERPRKDIAEKGGEFEIIQFWVNSPARHKMDPPNYFPLSHEETPVLKSKDGKTTIGVVSGELGEVKGVIPATSDLLASRIEMKEGGSHEFSISDKYNTFIYQMDGEISVNGGQASKGKNLIWFENDGKEFTVKAQEDTRFILLAGAPIKEPLATYGPFVMNNQREIIQALNDYQSGKMGKLEEVFE